MIFGLFGSGGSSTPDAPDYDTPDALKQFLNYSSTATMDDGPGAADFAENLFKAMQKGNLDQPTAMGLLNSRLAGNSSFYGSKKFSDFLNYEVPNENQDQIIQGAANTVFYRDLDSDDLSAYKTLAESMGKTGSPAELSNFIQTRMTGTLEGQNKYKDDIRRGMEAYYGMSHRDEKGNLTGGYGVFGTGDESVKMVEQANKKMGFLKNYSKKKMKAK